jgi:hypothetical protein
MLGISHLDGHTVAVLSSASFPFDTREELLDVAEGFLRELRPDKYPYVIEHAGQHLAEPNPDEPSEFEFGLDLILDGLERIRDAGTA